MSGVAPRLTLAVPRYRDRIGASCRPGWLQYRIEESWYEQPIPLRMDVLFYPFWADLRISIVTCHSVRLSDLLATGGGLRHLYSIFDDTRHRLALLWSSSSDENLRHDFGVASVCGKLRSPAGGSPNFRGLDEPPVKQSGSDTCTPDFPERGVRFDAVFLFVKYRNVT